MALLKARRTPARAKRVDGVFSSVISNVTLFGQDWLFRSTITGFARNSRRTQATLEYCIPSAGRSASALVLLGRTYLNRLKTSTWLFRRRCISVQMLGEITWSVGGPWTYRFFLRDRVFLSGMLGSLYDRFGRGLRRGSGAVVALRGCGGSSPCCLTCMLACRRFVERSVTTSVC